MIDKLDLRLPADAALAPQVREFIREGEFLGYGGRSRRSQHYQSVTDLRPIGIDAILHKGLRRDGTAYTGTHKLEILDAGEKAFSAWSYVIAQVFEHNPESLALMRLDTCADMRDVPVSWFAARVRVRYKRWSSRIGALKWQVIGNHGIETITAGKRPNFLRIYNKVEESAQRFRTLQRSRPESVPSFEELFGFSEGDTVTRVERQHTNRGVPKGIFTFGEIAHAPHYDPFTCMEFSEEVSPMDALRSGDASPKETCASVGAAFLRNEWGEQTFARWFNSFGGNYARFKRNRPNLFGSEDGSRMREQIAEEYRRSTMQQLSA